MIKTLALIMADITPITFDIKCLTGLTLLFTRSRCRIKNSQSISPKPENRESSAIATRSHRIHTVSVAVLRNIIWEEPLRGRLWEETARLLLETQRDAGQSVVPEQKNKVEEAGVGKSARFTQRSADPVTDQHQRHVTSQTRLLDFYGYHLG